MAAIVGENDFPRDNERQATGGRAQDIGWLIGVELDRPHTARGREAMRDRRFLTSGATPIAFGVDGALVVHCQRRQWLEA
jgi:hypothetical protein